MRDQERRARDLLVIPDLLRDLPRWITWHLDGRGSKVPDGSTLDPSFPRPFTDVADAPVGPDRGVGIVLTGGIDVDGHRLIALDVDACRDPATGALSGWAETVVLRLGRPFTEITPSRSGLRVWIFVRHPPVSVSRIRIDAEPPPGVDKRPEVQVFGANGAACYVAYTGDLLPGSSATILRTDSLDGLLHDLGADLSDDRGAAVLPTGDGDPPPPETILSAVLVHPDGEALVAGRWKELGVPSASEAWFRLVRIVLRVTRGHGDATVAFLLRDTAYGRGLVDSREPDRYMRQSWVKRDVVRIAGATGDGMPTAVAFDDGFDAESWTPPTGVPRGSLLLQAADFAARQAGQRFLVHGLLPAQGLAQLFGDPSSGKTPFALSLALHVALGLDWFGRDLDRPGPVVYLVGEDPGGIRDRLVAQLGRLDPTQTLADVPLWLSTRPAALGDRTDRKRWAAEIRERAAGARLVVADTQVRNFGPGNENATEDMAAFVAEVDALCRDLGCLALLVHHPGHATKGRGRGSSVLDGALDAQFEVRRRGRQVAAFPRKCKNWRKPDPLFGRLVEVPVGTDDRGRPMTAITLEEGRPDGAAVFRTDEAEDDLRAVLRAVRELGKDGASQRGIARATDLNRKAVAAAIVRAAELGLVVMSPGRGRPGTTCILTDAGAATLDGTRE